MLHGCFFSGIFPQYTNVQRAQQEIVYLTSLYFNFFYLHLFKANGTATHKDANLYGYPVGCILWIYL
jgi:hypothetical protein